MQAWLIVAALLFVPLLASADIDTQECIKVLQMARLHNQPTKKSHLEFEEYRPIPKNSITAQAGVALLGNGKVLLPRAMQVSRNLGLEEGTSPIFFIEVRGTEDNFEINIGGFEDLPVRKLVNDVKVNVYHFLIAHRYVAISVPNGLRGDESFEHDILSHMPGYYKLSQTDMWPQITRLMLETIYVESKFAVKSEIYRRAAKTRYELGKILETVSTKLSKADQFEEDPAPALKEMSDFLSQYLPAWEKHKSELNLVVPDRPFDKVLNPTWWEKFRYRLGI